MPAAARKRSPRKAVAKALPGGGAEGGVRSRRDRIDSTGGRSMNLANATIAQLLIPVEDLGKGVAFYRDTLGIPFLFQAPPQMAFFDCGGVRLLVGVMPEGQKAERGSAIYFQVPDIGAVHVALKDKGVRFRQEP